MRTILAGLLLTLAPSFTASALEAEVLVDEVGVKEAMCGTELRAFLRTYTATAEGCQYFTFDLNRPGGKSILATGLTAVASGKRLVVQYDSTQDPQCLGTTSVCKITNFVWIRR